MPANLNALVRYKTINSCLHGGRRKWSIEELIDACSDALAESRGRYEPVSERTIRDDIRVMRSDILGFNAPIEQMKGLYFYSDPGYSIMSISITDSGLATKIINLLLVVRTTVKHPELESILEKLMEMTGGCEVNEEPKKRVIGDSKDYSHDLPAPSSICEVESGSTNPKLKFGIQKSGLTWADVLKVILYL